MIRLSYRLRKGHTVESDRSKRRSVNAFGSGAF